MVEIANLHDVDEIVELIRSEGRYLVPRTHQEVSENIGKFVVIKEGNRVVACAAFENYSPKIAEIRSVVVRSECRGRGYGKAIIETLMNRAKKGQEVFVVTSKADYFKKLGFDTALQEKQFLFRIK